MNQYNVILKAFFLYVVLSAFCLLMWLVYGFNKTIMHPVLDRGNIVSVIGYNDTVSPFDHHVTPPTSSQNVKKHVHSTKGTSVHSIGSCQQLKNVKLFKRRKRVTTHEPSIEGSCNLLSTGNKLEIQKVKARRNKWKSELLDVEFLENLHFNCTKTRDEFNVFYSSTVEQSFPIAFEMLIYYKEGRIQQYLRLLKFLYRSHNAYCIHIDKKSPQWWQDHIKAFASCFPNILVAKNPIDIKYATATILQAHLRCLKDLLHSKVKWKYAITLHSTELPLVTNREIVEHLKALNGFNFITKGQVANSSNSQVRSWITYKVKSVNRGTWVVLSNERLDAVPHGIELYKSGSSANSALSRGFVKFFFKSQEVADLLVWLNDVHSAVEFFFSTVNQMPGAPGHSDITGELAHREWSHSVKINHKLCVELKVVHDICIVSLADLPRLTQLSKNRTYWFFNKYFINYDHVVMDCMEELLIQRNVKEYERDCIHRSY